MSPTACTTTIVTVHCSMLQLPEDHDEAGDSPRSGQIRAAGRWRRCPAEPGGCEAEWPPAPLPAPTPPPACMHFIAQSGTRSWTSTTRNSAYGVQCRPAACSLHMQHTSSLQCEHHIGKSVALNLCEPADVAGRSLILAAAAFGVLDADQTCTSLRIKFCTGVQETKQDAHASQLCRKAAVSCALQPLPESSM